MTGFNDLLLYFTIYSLLGWMIESVFVSLTEKKLTNRGFLHGTFCPIYGFGAILIIHSSKLVSHFFENRMTALVINVLLAVLLVTALEYITGLLLERIFNCKWWDYSKFPLNLHGYVCLQFSLIWGVLVFFLIRFIHPFISGLILPLPAAVKNILSAILLLYFLADTLKSVIDTLDLRKVILNYSNIPIERYHEKIIRYRRFFHSFPRLSILNAEILNRDIRSILNDKMGKIKVKLKNRFIQ